MTDETTTTTAERPALMIRFWKGFVRISMMHVQTRVIGLVLAGVIVFSGGAFLFNRQEQADSRQRASALADAEEKVFAASVIDHNSTVALYNVCLLRVEDQARTRETLRTLFFSFADLSDVLPGSPEAALYTANRTALIEGIYPPINVPAVQITQCVKPGPSPVDPTPMEES